MELKDIRMAEGLTIKAMSEKLGCALNTISQYETGKRVPNLETMYKIAKILQVDISVITNYFHNKTKGK